jgi:hypothetical protein
MSQLMDIRQSESIQLPPHKGRSIPAKRLSAGKYISHAQNPRFCQSLVRKIKEIMCNKIAIRFLHQIDQSPLASLVIRRRDLFLSID